MCLHSARVMSEAGTSNLLSAQAVNSLTAFDAKVILPRQSRPAVRVSEPCESRPLRRDEYVLSHLAQQVLRVPAAPWRLLLLKLEMWSPFVFWRVKKKSKSRIIPQQSIDSITPKFHIHRLRQCKSLKPQQLSLSFSVLDCSIHTYQLLSMCIALDQ